MSAPLISIIIPVRNGAATLDRCLRSIAANDYPAGRVRVVVADNGSTDDSAAVARRWQATVLDLPDLSVSELRNAAADAGGGDLLAFVDADHEIGPAWLRTAAALFADPSVGAVGAPSHCPEQGTWVQRQYDWLRGHHPGVRDVEWLGAGNMAVRRAAFEAAGRFDTRLETCEDVDLCARIKGTGYRILVDDRLHSTHYGDPPTLSALFRGELWRGRDNLRVTLRAASIRSLVSLCVPAADLLLVAVACLAPWSQSLAGLGAAGAALLGVFALASARVLAKSQAHTLDARNLPQLLLVAVVYDLGRAFALIARAGHRTRHAAPART